MIGCWKCQGTGRYWVARFIYEVDGYKVVWKLCDCGAKASESV